MKTLVAVFVFSLVSSSALGQTAPGWFSRQHNALGQWCCDSADGHLYDGAYTINPDGSVTLPAVDGTITLEAGKVLPFNPRDPNPTGSAVIWYWGDFLSADRAWAAYCFALGPLG